MTQMNKAQKNLIVFIIMIGTFLTSLNQTVLTSALPSIMSDFGVDASIGQWITTVYLLVLGIMIPTTAYLIGKFSTRKLFISSMGLFFIGCILSIIAQNFMTMILSRILQAIGAGIIMQLVQVTMISLYPVEQRGKAMGIYGFAIGFAPVVGPVVAGYMIDILGWRSIFYVLGFIAITDIIVAFLLLKNVGKTKKSTLEVISVILSTLGFGGLLAGFSNVGIYGIANPITNIPMIIGILSLIVFVKRQLKVETPLLELRVFKNTNFTISTILSVIIYMAMMSATVIISLYVQSVRGYSAVVSGMLMLPGSILMAILSPIAGNILDKYGPRKLVTCGFIFLGIGTSAFSMLSQNTPLIYLSTMFCFRMIGITSLLMPVTTWGINALKPEEISHGSAINTTLRQVSGAIGSSVLISIMAYIASNSKSSSVAVANIKGMNASFRVATAIIAVGIICSVIYVKDDNLYNEEAIG